MTFQRMNFVGFGIGWNRRSVFDYGWIAVSLPFFEIIVAEWRPDDEEWERRYA